ncbi:MAG: hypothetical protein II695_11670 [Oscillospiraceae bacterium]|nr:hypothetical protein [Oscillospiraceae bacterium]
MSRKNKNKNKPKDSEIKAILDEAFEEDISEITDLAAEQPAQPAEHSHLHFIVGLFVIIMSIVGIICSAVFAYGRIVDILNNTGQKSELEKFIYPVVICDPPTFEQSQRFRNDTMISAAAWDIIMYADKTRYSYEFDYIIVPEIDIEQHAAQLFGANLTLEHHTISNSDVSFYYDESIKSYRIPEEPQFFTYTPKIEDITRQGDIYTLRVGYLAPVPSWIQDTRNEQRVPFKYMNYTVEKHGNSYTLISINSVTDQVTDISGE